MNLLLDRFCVKATLEQSLQLTYEFLQAFAKAEDFTSKMRITFGDRFDVEAANKLAIDWERGDFTELPQIVILSTHEINGAVGAFAKANNTIYLSREYLNQNASNTLAIASVLLEEVGHYVDACINDFEAPGDEGAIFSLLVRGESLSDQQLQQLREENDFAVVTIDGQTIEIEQANFTGTNGDDFLPLVGDDNSGDDTFDPLLGFDTVDGGDGNDVLIVNYYANSLIFDNNGNGILLTFGGSNDGEVSFSNIERFNITGTNFANNIYGGAGNDTINGGDGNDTIISSGGSDQIDGGFGLDQLLDADFAAATTDLTLNDTGISQEVNGSTITGIELFGMVQTGSGKDLIAFTRRSDNDIIAGSGDDTINSGLGYDSVDGGDGNDVLVVNYATSESRDGGLYGFRFSDGSGYFSSFDGSNFDQVSFSNIEQFNITGTGFADFIEGGAGNDTLNGGAGNDIIKSGSGTDQIDGGSGLDQLLDVNFATATADLTLNDTGLSQQVNGSNITGIEFFGMVQTGSGKDLIAFTRRSDNDIITGSGDDTINSGLGYDSVDGGDGNDVLVVNYATSGTRDGNGLSSVKNQDGSGYFFTFDGSNFDRVNFIHIEQFNVTGTNFTDFIEGGAGNDTLNGGDGNDTIESGGGSDQIDGGSGLDRLVDANFATATADLALNDSGLSQAVNGSTIAGIDLFDVVRMGSGKDQIAFTRRSDNYIVTGSGDDTVNSGLGYDIVDGGEGNDVLVVNYAASGSDGNGLYSSQAPDGSGSFSAFDGSNLDQVSFSNIEQFNITGTNFTDFIEGGAGNDTLNGGAGNDSLTGSNGNDTYIVDLMG